MTTRHFLTTGDFSSDELEYLIQRGIELKRVHASSSMPASGNEYQPFSGRVLAMIFEKSSTRTRVSFEAGMAQFGGQALFLSSRDTQLGRGEPVEDSAKVLSRMVDLIMIRTYSHSNLEHFARNSRVPVINALTDDFHPCQLLADMQTYYEHRGSIRGRTVAWIGDGNNMCNSYIDAAAGYGFKLRIACPEGYRPDQSLLDSADVHVTASLEEAVDGADLVVTDVWASMGQEEEALERASIFAPYQVTPELMAAAGSGALFMHCLPAHRGEEVSDDMLNHASSVVWDEAENRLHAQKALMEFLLLGRVG